MHRSYEDITSKLGPPLWWDDNGVPRYEAFDPELLGVYDRLGLLLLIECQACEARFNVAIALDGMAIHCSNLMGEDGTLNRKAAAEVGVYAFHYGDPPRHGGCVGETMQSTMKKVLQAWTKESMVTWARVPELELL